MPHYLGIDASTQSITGLIIDTDAGSIVAESSINFDEHFSQKYGTTNGVVDLGAGAVHSYPLMWVEALKLLLHTLRRQGHDLSRITAISGSGQQHGTVYLNQTAASTLANINADRDLHEQLTGIFSRKTAPVWMDSSTSLQCEQITSNLGGSEALLNLTGNAAFERFSGPQIRKFYEQEPQAYAKTASITLVSSFIASVLAGKLAAVDAGDGSGTNLMDIRSRQWSPEAQNATAAELAKRMAPITPLERPVGTIHPYFIKRHGFPSDCLVVPFSGDNPCSLVGLGIVEPGQVALSLGTSDTLFACMQDLQVSTEGEGCVFVSADDRHYMALICFSNGSLAREAVRDRYGLDWHGFTDILKNTKPGNDGRLMLPYFEPEIVPQAPAGVVRTQLDETDAAGNVRAVIEAQAMSSCIHSRWMGVDISSLHVTGGGSANEEILKVFANIHGCPVHRGETTNAAALGAALRAYRGHQPDVAWSTIVAPFCQSEGATIYPDAATRPVYDELIAAYADFERGH